ncbi:hypothetical protein V8E53_004162 [Lactarius tabidus]
MFTWFIASALMSYEADLTRALEHVGIKALVAQSKEVFMEVRNMILKACAPEKGMLEVCSPLKPGMTVFCWIETAEEGVKGGHHKMSHHELTIWAKYITCGLATKTCPPNIKSLDYPPTKKVRTAKAAPEFHIAVNLAPTLGGGALCCKGHALCPIPRFCDWGWLLLQDPHALKRPLRPKDLESCAAHQIHFQAAGSIYILKTCRMLLQMLSDCAKSGRVPNSYDILTWMDTEHPQVDRHYMDSYSNFETFGINDMLDIMELEVCYLASFGQLGHDGAQCLSQYMQDKILIPLNLWETKVESYDSGIGSVEVAWIFKWQKEVEPGYIEDIEDIEGIEEVKVEEVEEVVEEEGGGLSLDIMETLNFDYTAVNVGSGRQRSKKKPLSALAVACPMGVLAPYTQK